MLASRIFANSRNLMLPFNPLFTGSSVGKVFRFDSILGGFSAGKIAKCWLKLLFFGKIAKCWLKLLFGKIAKCWFKLIEDNQILKGKVQNREGNLTNGSRCFTI